MSVLTAPAAGAAEPAAPETVCTINDKRVGELSGLASDGENRYAINDGGSRIEIFVLGRDCGVRKVITSPTDPFDVEDLARGADGTLWLADTGDNRKQRDTVALHAVTPQGKSTLYRLTYPDGQHDTEALLLDRSGTPFLITKNVLGEATIYRPAGKLASPGPTALEKAGSVSLKTTDTPGGPVGSLGSVLVTGAASTPDGKVIALRTYTDAYLYPAPDGDVVAALGREPVRVPLPNEKQGEAIAFDPDGTLLSGTEGAGQPLRAVRGAAALVADRQGDARAVAGDPQGNASSGGSGVPVLPGIVIAVGVAGLLLFGVNRLRRRARR
ncbi:hypothetical protein [Amycolatopsis anabasis]|uniref:hypothetical protein n=1 Tax=Amycolatopsis anabasis TaxID=1840409 RepID=UPI00131B19DF|nr:hypothetical protein [Amycolatopsis anabasis]